MRFFILFYVVYYRFSVDCLEGSSSTSSGFEVDFNECHSEC